MRFKVGDMLTGCGQNKYGTALWDDAMADAVGSFTDQQFVIVVKTEDDYGWVKVLTCDGTIGIVHRTNLVMIHNQPAKPKLL